MKQMILCAVALAFTLTVHAGAWTWASSLPATGMVRAWDLAGEPGDGAVWVGGQFDGTLSLGGNSYPSGGLADAFVGKYSEEGNLQWLRQFGSPEEDVCLSLAVGNSGTGNCYFSGYFNDTMSAYGYELSSAGLWDVFFGKLNPGGEVLWLKRFGGSLNDIGYGIAVDSQDNCIVAGWFAGSIDFGSGITMQSYGGSDMFVAKFDPQGNCLWARHGGDVGVEYGYKVDVNQAGEVFVTGVAGQGANFDGQAQTQDGLFVAKYSPTGTILWVSSALNAGPINLCVEKSASPGYRGLVAGRVTGFAVFGGQTLYSNSGTDDIMLAEFDPETGAWLQAQLWGGPGSDKGRAVDVGNGYALLASYEETVDFGSTTLSSTGNWDGVVISENLQPHALGFGSVNTDVATDIRFVSAAGIVVCGWFNGFMRLGEFALDSGSDAIQNGFIARYDFGVSVADDFAVAALPHLRCHPNPFRANLELIGVRDARMEIRVFNQRGQLIRALRDPELRSGTMVWNWDGRDHSGNRCPAGIYLLGTGGPGGIVKALLLD